MEKTGRNANIVYFDGKDQIAKLEFIFLKKTIVLLRGEAEIN